MGDLLGSPRVAPLFCSNRVRYSIISARKSINLLFIFRRIRNALSTALYGGTEIILFRCPLEEGKIVEDAPGE